MGLVCIVTSVAWSTDRSYQWTTQDFLDRSLLMNGPMKATNAGILKISELCAKSSTTGWLPLTHSKETVLLILR
jgi:hypothetical protein